MTTMPSAHSKDDDEIKLPPSDAACPSKDTVPPPEPAPNFVPFPLTQEQLVRFAYQTNPRVNYMDKMAEAAREKIHSDALQHVQDSARSNSGGTPLPGIACVPRPEDFHAIIKSLVLDCMRKPNSSAKQSKLTQQTPHRYHERKIFPEDKTDRVRSFPNTARPVTKGIEQKAPLSFQEKFYHNSPAERHQSGISVPAMSSSANNSDTTSALKLEENSKSQPCPGKCHNQGNKSPSHEKSVSTGTAEHDPSVSAKPESPDDTKFDTRTLKVKLPFQSPSKSYQFLNSIICTDTGKRFQPNSKTTQDFKCSRSSDSADLPFSILTIREQREYLKRSGESFVQDAPCYDVARMYGVETSGPSFGQNSWCKCRECRSVKQKESLAVFCRFYGFRKLKFESNVLCTAGFLLPEECAEKDLQLWLPRRSCFWEDTSECKDILSPNDPLDQKMSEFILMNIAKRFCDIVLLEKKAMSWVEQEEVIFWKKPVSGVREMCDVCETTLFNMHWVCRKCGYGVCLDCYERRMTKTTAEQEVYDSNKMNCFRWARCVKGKNHFHSSMLPTQIIPSTCLLDLSEMVHNVCSTHGIKTLCPCQISYSPAEILLKLQRMNSDDKQNTALATDPFVSRKRKLSEPSPSVPPPRPIEPKVKELKVNGSNAIVTKQPSICLVDLLNRKTWSKPIVSQTLNMPKVVIADPPIMQSVNAPNPFAQQTWLCEGKLLQLTDSQHPNNIDVFKLHWKYGMPVLVSGVGNYLNMKLWHPEQLSREYGDENSKNSLVNCMSGSVITNMKIRDFWDGFENISQRLLDEQNKTMILKLKDWPPTQAFRDVMPEMFQDLMRALPLPEYTFIDGKCNLAARLPHFFVKPDLGPKMYNAYGWVTETNWKQGTTNLHLDISDAVNIMVYVGIPVDEPQEARDTLLQIVREGEVDNVQFQRALTDKPGALWHIFHQRDVDKIRRFIKKVCGERGETVPPDHDPIHDQQMYLDRELRHRLKKEYNVEGYAILQCQGDGVFIPAGAPHQVFNLHSCIKIAEDFVSPEHVDKCFTLTNEFRYLSSTHSNHEDKLQIKNIIYHAVKDIVSSSMHGHCL